ncbi:MAG: copper resistance protein CopC, partial [Geminicoccales bacterium]
MAKLAELLGLLRRAVHQCAARPDSATAEQHHHRASEHADNDGRNEERFEHPTYYTIVGEVLLCRCRALAPLATGAILLTSLALALPESASAHAYLVRSTPEAGARLNRSPATLLLYFSEPFVRASERISLRRPGGETIAAPPAVRRGTVVRQPLPARLGGVIVVHWSVISDDGHPSLGEFAFAVGAAGELPALRASASQPTPWGQAAAVWLFFAGLALALGGLVSERFIWRGTADVAGPPVALGLFVAANGALLHILLLAADRAGALAELRSPADLALALDTRAGRLTLGILLLLALAAAATRWRRLRIVAIGALLATTVASAVRGHSGSSGHGWAVPADALHLAAAAIWIGALVHLVRVVYAAPAEDRRGTLAHGVRRYASLALVTVLVAIVAGLVTALAQFGSLGELVDTGYGQTLLTKGTLIGIALVVALAARTRALALPWPAWALLRRVGVFELASGAIVLLLVALLVGSAPVQLVSSVVFAGTLLVCAVAVRYTLIGSEEGGIAALVVAGVSGVIALNAGIVATGAAFVRQGWGAGGEAMVGTRMALAAAAGGLAVGAVARALSRGGALRLPLLRRLTTA